MPISTLPLSEGYHELRTIAARRKTFAQGNPMIKLTLVPNAWLMIDEYAGRKSSKVAKWSPAEQRDMEGGN